MIRIFRKGKKHLAQSLLEYTMVIALVALAIIAMNRYVFRAVWAGIKGWELQVNDSLVAPVAEVPATPPPATVTVSYRYYLILGGQWRCLPSQCPGSCSATVPQALWDSTPSECVGECYHAWQLPAFTVGPGAGLTNIVCYIKLIKYGGTLKAIIVLPYSPTSACSLSTATNRCGW
jgi:hypothetical protein